jgi:biotin carboxyl carrier protein
MNEITLQARALLEQFRNGEWRDLYVRTARYALFIARPGGAANPMRGASARIATAKTASAAAVAVPTRDSKSIVAPHIGTVAWIEALGSTVVPGDVVARIEVLGTLFDINAEFAGRVDGVAAPIGTLVQFGATIATMAARNA